MKRFFARHALLPDGWAENVRFEVDAWGSFASVTPHSSPEGALPLPGLVLSGMPNAHSHAFQRAFAGRTERASPAGDSFWTWREAMYGLLEAMDPDEFERVTTDAYAAMLRAGYTSVCEFHYVHNGPGGAPYDRTTELADRVVAAARHAGIGLTLLPVYYRFGSFDARAPTRRQARFVTSFDAFANLVRALHATYSGDPQITIGIAPHSLRAVPLDDLPRLVTLANDVLGAHAPLHMHVSEQVAEVEACRAALGRTPIDALRDRIDLDERWCLVHATHATPAELAALCASTSVVALCPTTEANLGDGIFPAASFARDGGTFAIGSDSNVSIDVAEELRWLEYAQRLTLHERNVMHGPHRPAVGRFLYEAALRGGARASGRAIGALAAGQRADLVALAEPGGDDPDERLAVALFRSGSWKVTATLCGGAYRTHAGDCDAG